MAGKLAYMEPGPRRAELAAAAENREVLLAALGAMVETHLGMFHDAAGKLLPTSEWTPSMWACVRRLKYGDDGSVKWIELSDRLTVIALLMRVVGLGGSKSEEGRFHLDALLNEFTGAPAGDAPADVAVVPGAGAKLEKAARRKANRDEFYRERAARRRAAKAAKDGGGGDG